MEKRFSHKGTKAQREDEMSCSSFVRFESSVVERTHFFCYSVEFKGRKESAMKSECSRQVGKRKLPKIKGVPSGELLKQGAEWNDEMHRMFPFRYMPRGGVLFFKTMEASNQHEEACRAAAMAKRAKERMHE